MDKIHITDLQLRCIIGIYPEERREKQDVIFNITLYADLSRAGQSDAIADTVDYKAVKQGIRTMVENSSFNLLEKLAAEVARLCLNAPGVLKVAVRVDKPAALRFARSVAVEIEREQKESVGRCPSSPGRS